MKPLLIVTLLLWFASGADARTWTLLNGDRISGNLVAETATTVTIEHPQLGRVSLPRAALAPEKISAAVAALAVAKPAPWKRQVEFGYSASSGSASSQNLSARVELDGKDGPDTYQATAHVLEAEAAGITSSDERAADFRWRHDLTPALFTQTLTSWQSEPVRQLDQSWEQQVGGGVKVLASGGQTADVGLGAAARYQDYAGVSSQTAVLGTVFEDYAFTWKNGIRMGENASMALASDRPFSPSSGAVGAPAVPADGGNYRVRFDTLLQGKVTPQVTINLRYDLDYDRSVPDPTARATRRLTTSLGYLW